MSSPLHRPHLTPEDRRFHGLWTALALAALLAVMWAAHQTVDDAQLVVERVPDRILLLLEPPEHPDAAAPKPATGKRVGLPRPTASPLGPSIHGPVRLDPGAADAFERFFHHEVFGGPDATLDDLARTLDGPQGVDPFDPGVVDDDFRSGVGDSLREDAVVGRVDRVARGPVVMVHPEASAPSLAILAPIAPVEQLAEVPSRVVEQGVRSWRRHAAACHATHAPDFSGRIELRSWVVDGRPERVSVEVSEADRLRLAPLSKCLSLRARALLSFAEAHTGEARIPLVFEAR